MSNRVGSEKKGGNISIYQGTGLLYALPQKTVTLFIGTIKSEVWLLSITNKLDLSLSIFTQYHHAFFHHRERRVFNYFFHCYAWLHLVVRWCEQVQHLYFPEISFYSHAESKGYWIHSLLRYFNIWTPKSFLLPYIFFLPLRIYSEHLPWPEHLKAVNIIITNTHFLPFMALGLTQELWVQAEYLYQCSSSTWG